MLVKTEELQTYQALEQMAGSADQLQVSYIATLIMT